MLWRNFCSVTRLTVTRITPVFGYLELHSWSGIHLLKIFLCDLQVFWNFLLGRFVTIQSPRLTAKLFMETSLFASATEMFRNGPPIRDGVRKTSGAMTSTFGRQSLAWAACWLESGPCPKSLCTSHKLVSNEQAVKCRLYMPALQECCHKGKENW